MRPAPGGWIFHYLGRHPWPQGRIVGVTDAAHLLEVVDYDPEWPVRFREERVRLAAAIPQALAIEHVGSTSVPGLSAKPTIDVLAVVDAVRDVDRAALSRLGYEYRPGSFADDDDHLFFRRISSGRRTHHLHVLVSSSPRIVEQLLDEARDFFSTGSNRAGVVRRADEGPAHIGPRDDRRHLMRFMVLVLANEVSETGKLPSTEELEAMSRYNEELVKAGVMLAADGLHASAKGARVTFEGGKSTVIDGPFTEAKELVAGYWIWQVKSKAEAIEWLKRAPFDGGAVVEIRQIHEEEDFAEVSSPETSARDAQLREQLAQQ